MKSGVTKALVYLMCLSDKDLQHCAVALLLQLVTSSGEVEKSREIDILMDKNRLTDGHTMESDRWTDSQTEVQIHRQTDCFILIANVKGNSSL